MEIILGFRTPNAQEIPAILYLGDDADTALRIAEETKFPRVARLRNPQLFPIRHWSEAASEAYEASLPQPAVTETPAAATQSSAAAASAETHKKRR